MNTSDLKSFHYLESGEITFSLFNTDKTVGILDKGCYKLSYFDNYPESRVKLDQSTDKESTKVHSFPDKERIDNLITSFFTERVIDAVSKLGFYHKVGILLYGKEGTGKSTIIKHYYTRLINERKALVFHMNCYNHRLKECWDFVTKIRRIQNNPIVVVFDEFDIYLKGDGNIGVLKSLIDGNMSITNCLFFASTNHIEDIPAAFKSRPSRFKYSMNIEGVQDEGEVFHIMRTMLNGIIEDVEIKQGAKELAGSTLDAIKQFCLDKIMEIKTTAPSKPTIGFQIRN